MNTFLAGLRPHFSKVALSAVLLVSIGSFAFADDPANAAKKGDEFLVAGKFMQAEKQYEKAMEAGLNGPDVQLGLANAYTGQSKFDQALVILKNLTTGTPTYTQG